MTLALPFSPTGISGKAAAIPRKLKNSTCAKENPPSSASLSVFPSHRVSCKGKPAKNSPRREGLRTGAADQLFPGWGRPRRKQPGQAAVLQRLRRLLRTGEHRCLGRTGATCSTRGPGDREMGMGRYSEDGERERTKRRFPRRKSIAEAGNIGEETSAWSHVSESVRGVFPPAAPALCCYKQVGDART